MKSGVNRIGHDIAVTAAKRGCFDKVRYPNKNVARDCARKLQQKYEKERPQRPYRCSLCDGWHLTSQEPDGLKYRPKEDRRKVA